MPESLPRLRERVRELERDVARLTSRADRAPERLPVMSELRNPRLAITAYDPNDGTYPSSPADTYWIIFVDATYDKTDDGQQTVTKTDRQTSARVVARSLVDEYLERDTLVEVIWDNGRWWISKTTGLSIAIYQIVLGESGAKDQLIYDGAVAGFYVWGQPMTESASPMVINTEADKEKLYLVTYYKGDLDRVDGIGSLHVGDRVYTASRNGRREIVAHALTDPRWEIFALSESGETVPSGGVMRVSDIARETGGWLEFKTSQPTGASDYGFQRPCFLNHSFAVAHADNGRCAIPAERPIWAAIKFYHSQYLNPGASWGPAPDSWLLYPGLPGFQFVSSGNYNTDYFKDGDDNYWAAMVIDWLNSTWWAKATADWVNGTPSHIIANPCLAGYGSQPYDGTGDYPEISIWVDLPRHGSREDPNIHTGDYFRYSLQGLYNTRQVVGVAPYLDGVIGEVRWHAKAPTANPGWVYANGIDNAILNGGSGINYIGMFLRGSDALFGSGGAVTHTHSFSPGGGWIEVATGTHKIDPADHTPEWQGAMPYERIH